MTDPNIPTAWSDDTVLEGLDILDKSQLLNVPFRILGCVFQNNNDNVSICYIDAERADGYQFTFLDSSTGVRAQLVKHLADIGQDAVIDSGEYAEFKLVAPNGLRLSEYLQPLKGPNGQPLPGKTRVAKTYYLTTSGKRGAASKATPKAKPAPRASAAK